MFLLTRLSKTLDRTTAPVRKLKANSEFNGPPLSGCYLRVVALVLALQLRFLKGSESMGNHDSNIVDACCVD
jgi:hypothetical protein